MKIQLEISSKVRPQPRQMSSPAVVEQMAMQGESGRSDM